MAAHHVNIHRRLGIFGFCLASLMVILGALAPTNMLARNVAPPDYDPKGSTLFHWATCSIFAVLIFFAFRARLNSAAHKRLILVATVFLLTAAFARFHLDFLFLKIVPAMLLSYAFLVFLAIYDLWSTHKLHRATLLDSALVICMQFLRSPFAHTSAWQSAQHLAS